MSPNSKFQFLYVVLDVVASAISGPVIMLASDPVAIRTFSDAVLGPNSLLSLHPDDYKLVKVGAINVDTGVITPLEPNDLITARTVIDLSTRDREASNG